MTRKEIWKDFFKKVMIPVLLTGFLFYWGTKIFTQNGETNYFYVWLFCGVPFGIRRMFLWLIPINHDFTATVGIFAVNIIAGGLIGCIVMAASCCGMVCPVDGLPSVDNGKRRIKLSR